MIFIKSKNEGFRRAGVAHSKKGKEFPDSFFTFDQLVQLKSDPMLSVEIKRDPTPKDTEPKVEDLVPDSTPKPQERQIYPVSKPKTKQKKSRAKGK